MPPLETKQSRGKLLPLLDLQKVWERGCFYRKYQTEQFADTVKLKRKRYNTHCEELALKEDVDLWQVRLQNESHTYTQACMCMFVRIDMTEFFDRG